MRQKTPGHDELFAKEVAKHFHVVPYSFDLTPQKIMTRIENDVERHPDDTKKVLLFKVLRYVLRETPSGRIWPGRTGGESDEEE